MSQEVGGMVQSKRVKGAESAPTRRGIVVMGGVGAATAFALLLGEFGLAPAWEAWWRRSHLRRRTHRANRWSEST